MGQWWCGYIGGDLCGGFLLIWIFGSGCGWLFLACWLFLGGCGWLFLVSSGCGLCHLSVCGVFLVVRYIILL